MHHYVSGLACSIRVLSVQVAELSLELYVLDF